MINKNVKSLMRASALVFGLGSGAAYALDCSETPVQSGEATYYGTKEDGYAGGKTFSGEILTHNAMTAASNHFPMGTMLKVEWNKGGRDPAVIVRVNDTGGFSGPTVIDLNVGPAEKLGMINAGRIPVNVYRCE